MAKARKARAVGFNHVALEVGDIERGAGLLWPPVRIHAARQERGSGLHRSRRPVPRAAEGPTQPADDGRHFGLVVDDKEAVRKALAEAGVKVAARAASSTSSTPGATASRSSATTTSSSPRRRTCCAAWAWPISRRTRGHQGAGRKGHGAGVAEAPLPATSPARTRGPDRWAGWADPKSPLSASANCSRHRNSRLGWMP